VRPPKNNPAFCGEYFLMDVWIDENPLWGAQRPGSETVVGENKPLKKFFVLIGLFVVAKFEPYESMT